MPLEVVGDLLPRSLAACEAYWHAQGLLTAAQRRRRKLERNYRRGCAARSYLPDDSDWVIQEMRSGEWERRTRRNMRGLLRDRAKLTLWKRDEEHRLVAPALARIHVAPRRANPERRPAARRSARAPTSDDPSPEPDPPVEVWRGVAAASVRMHTRLAQRRAKWAAT
jgi:hypothetical protein